MHPLCFSSYLTKVLEEESNSIEKIYDIYECEVRFFADMREEVKTLIEKIKTSKQCKIKKSTDNEIIFATTETIHFRFKWF